MHVPLLHFGVWPRGGAALGTQIVISSLCRFSRAFLLLIVDLPPCSHHLHLSNLLRHIHRLHISNRSLLQVPVVRAYLANLITCHSSPIHQRVITPIALPLPTWQALPATPALKPGSVVDKVAVVAPGYPAVAAACTTKGFIIFGVRPGILGRLVCEAVVADDGEQVGEIGRRIAGISGHGSGKLPLMNVGSGDVLMIEGVDRCGDVHVAWSSH